jgi:hypothetical protein
MPDKWHAYDMLHALLKTTQLHSSWTFSGQPSVPCSAAPRSKCDYTDSPPVVANRTWYGYDGLEMARTEAERAEYAVNEALGTRPLPTILSGPHCFNG